MEKFFPEMIISTFTLNGFDDDTCNIFCIFGYDILDLGNGFCFQCFRLGLNLLGLLEQLHDSWKRIHGGGAALSRLHPERGSQPVRAQRALRRAPLAPGFSSTLTLAGQF